MTTDDGRADNHDANNRVIRTVEADGTSSAYAYDANGNLQTKTYADGSKESYAYDVWGHMTGYTDRTGKQT